MGLRTNGEGRCIMLLRKEISRDSIHRHMNYNKNKIYDNYKDRLEARVSCILI